MEYKQLRQTYITKNSDRMIQLADVQYHRLSEYLAILLVKPYQKVLPSRFIDMSIRQIYYLGDMYMSAGAEEWKRAGKILINKLEGVKFAGTLDEPLFNFLDNLNYLDWIIEQRVGNTEQEMGEIAFRLGLRKGSSRGIQ